MRCPYCATDNRPNAHFCRVCGQLLTGAPAAPEPGDGSRGSEATLEMPWPPPEPPATASAPQLEPDGDPATLEFPTDFSEASAVAVQENLAESHSDTTHSATPADNGGGTRAMPAGAGAVAGVSVAAAAVEGRTATIPPPTGLTTDITDRSLASPPSEGATAKPADSSSLPADNVFATAAPTLPTATAVSDETVNTLPAHSGHIPMETAGAGAPNTGPTGSEPVHDLSAAGPDSAGVAGHTSSATINAATDSMPSASSTPHSSTSPIESDSAGAAGPALGESPGGTTPSAALNETDVAGTPTTATDQAAGDQVEVLPTGSGRTDETALTKAATTGTSANSALDTPAQQAAPLHTADGTQQDELDQSTNRYPPAAVAPLPPFGEPETVADPPGSTATGTSATAGDAPVETGSLSADATTSRLREDDAPVVAAPVPGEAFPALQVGALVAGRYTISQVLQTGPQRQSYLATDGQGYLRCWACGSRENIQGELYCTNCGAQLTGRTYRLFETPPGTPANEIAPPLLENLHSGVAAVFDSLTDAATGRHYLVLEDVGGKSLTAALTPPPDSAENPPTETHLLAWVAAAAQTLAELHAAQVVGCDFTPQALGVLPDDRLILVDPSACRMAGTVGDERGPQAEQQADVQRVAATLEQWITVRAAAGTADDNTASLTPTINPPAASRPPQTEDTIHTILARGREGAYKTAAEFAAALHELLAADQQPADLQLISGRSTDVGVQRKLNEDSLFALETVTIETGRSMPTALYIVADGMGGHDGGEVASSIAVRTIPAMLNSILDGRVNGDSGTPDQATLDEALREAILEANRRITELGRQRQSDMGTTVTLALVLGNSVTVANVGDSRTYLWRDGKLHQISEDHSLVARLIAAGQLTAEEGRHFERRNEIYRALGDGHLTPDDVDVFHAHLRPLDALVLCSDGLWEMVRDADIERIMLDAPDPPAATQALIAAANRAGGEDNITVIIAQTLTSSEDAND